MSLKYSKTKLNNEDSISSVAGCSTKLLNINNNGFTLVEVVVSAMLILIISVPFINFIVSTLKARTMAQERLTAMSIAVETIEEITSVQGEDWKDIDDLISWIKEESMGFTDTENSNIYFRNDGKYTIYIEINEEQPKDENGSVIEGLFEVIITVKYDNDKDISLLTVFREV